LPDFITYTDNGTSLTVTVSPTHEDQIKTYSLMMTKELYQGLGNHQKDVEMLEVHVTCLADKLTLDATENALIVIPATFTIQDPILGAPAPITFTPKYTSTCPIDPTLMSVRLVLNGDANAPLPSFIKIVGDYPNAEVQIVGGALAEGMKTY